MIDDNDDNQYGHINNAVYHAIFDSVINVYLIRNVGLDTSSPDSPRGFMATNSCTFHGSASYPNIYMAGFTIEKMGRTSGKWALLYFIVLKIECYSELQTRSVPLG